MQNSPTPSGNPLEPSDEDKAQMRLMAVKNLKHKVAIREITKNKEDGNRQFKGNKIKNEALRAMKVNQAIGEYGKGVEKCEKYFDQVDRSNPLFEEYQALFRALLGNRSLAFMSRGRYEDALKDGERAVQVDPAWGKGHYRCGAALRELHRNAEAELAFARAVEVDPKNSGAKKQLRELRSQGANKNRTSSETDKVDTTAATRKTAPKKSEASDELQEGDFVEAQWKEPSEYPGWHGATIAKIDNSNSDQPLYTIHYDDGGRWNKCPANMVRTAPIDVIEKKRKAKERRESGQAEDDLGNMSPQEMAQMMKYMQSRQQAGGAGADCPQQ